MRVYDRKTGEYYEEKQYGGGFLKKLYGTSVGRFFMPIVLTPGFSKIGGFFTDTPMSAIRNKKFIEKNHIDMSEYEERTYTSLDDLFTRKIKKGMRPICFNMGAFISPCDSKLSVYPIQKDNKIKIKGNEYTVAQLTGLGIDLDEFQNGYCLVFRLSVDDYHRYCSPVTGRLGTKKNIKGKLHTVCDISGHYRVLQENSRVVNLFRTAEFGNVVMVEVGALMVGRIVNHEQVDFIKGDEKGYFRMGGSTIVVLIQGHVFKLDEDIQKHLDEGCEVKVRYGEKIGQRPW
ncbi:MAG: phosphatidylserine decarboxylase [Clostridiales bacterium]|nr:phosphatidylserine decarboxylase [Clostridiales bacterium]